MRSHWVFAGLAVLLASGCYVSEDPLNPPDAAERDPQLIGKWRCVSRSPDAEATAVITVKPFDATQYEVEFAEGENDPYRYRGHGARLGNAMLVSLREIRDGSPGAAWVFVRYEFVRPTILEMRIVDEPLLKGLGPKAALNTIRNEVENADLYRDFCVCVLVKGP